MSTTNVKMRKIILIVFSCVFIILGFLFLISTILGLDTMQQTRIALCLNMTTRQYIVTGVQGLQFLIVGVVFGVLGLKVKTLEN
ncbi:MAG: hypothetical protein ACTSQ4_07745 [Candidatus Heimdallarchaeaceae archaeon]